MTCVLSYKFEGRSPVSAFKVLSPTWVTRRVWHPASVGRGAAEVHQDHGGGALRHDHGRPTPSHPHQLAQLVSCLLPSPPGLLPQSLAWPPASPVTASCPWLISWRSLLLLRQSFTPASLSGPENMICWKIFCAISKKNILNLAMKNILKESTSKSVWIKDPKSIFLDLA